MWFKYDAANEMYERGPCYWPTVSELHEIAHTTGYWHTTQVGTINDPFGSSDGARLPRFRVHAPIFREMMPAAPISWTAGTQPERLLIGVADSPAFERVGANGQVPVVHGADGPAHDEPREQVEDGRQTSY